MKRALALILVLTTGCATLGAPVLLPGDQPYPVHTSDTVKVDGVCMSTAFAAQQHRNNVEWQTCCTKCQAKLGEEPAAVSGVVLVILTGISALAVGAAGGYVYARAR